MQREPIIVVSGLPRSGTSMMMQMLAAGGLPVLADGRREADDDNPRGYFEYDPVKALAEDSGWIASARGKAVKVVSALLGRLPLEETYAVIFMQRPIDEVLASQRAMLARNGVPASPVADARIRDLFLRHLADVDAWLASQRSLARLEIRYHEAVAAPGQIAERVNRFLGGGLDVGRMTESVAPALHRQR